MSVRMASGREMRKHQVFMNANGQIVNKEEALQRGLNLDKDRNAPGDEGGKEEKREATRA